jgi:hypothetical protein
VRTGKWSPKIVFKVFDAPQADGDWAQRMAEAHRIVKGLSFAFPVEFGIVGRGEDPSAIAARIIAGGGEGAIFRTPGVCRYQQQRTVNLMRVKEGNLYAPWRQASEGRRRRHEIRQAMAQTRPVVGLDVRLFPFEPEIDWNIRQLLGDTTTDFSAATKF